MLRQVVLGAAAVLGLSQGAAAQGYNGLELPPYQVVARDGAVEVRDYAPHILAEVTVEGERRAALTQGFRVLARYIFGGNQAADKIAMTAPVAQSEKIEMTAPVAQTGDGARWTVTFMMPARYSLETLPQPESAAVVLRQEPASRQAVRRFSGRATERRLAEEEAALLQWMAGQGLEATGPVAHYYYDDPFTLPSRRRNEVAFPVR
ncbi:SOUL family heme-binding protein [Aestuariibius sp. 2305UL40-4]|uniref:SOUL family heme-binding protein n=1 Tax=Aestuariibius violaceus TaxID=3234132 RepID=UPI00345EF2C5